jgi:hypothetical protein
MGSMGGSGVPEKQSKSAVIFRNLGLLEVRMLMKKQPVQALVAFPHQGLEHVSTPP